MKSTNDHRMLKIVYKIYRSVQIKLFKNLFSYTYFIPMQSRPLHSAAQSPNNRRVLPPQVDQQITFGIMWIRVGKLKLTSRKGNLQNKLIVQFWGQKLPLYLETKSNPLNHNQANTMIEYDIKCPVTYFKEYLLDMKKNLRIQVQDVGKVDFDITKFLKPHVDLNSRYAFDHFKGAFQINGKHNRKIGSIQLEMACNFNPELAALQIQDEEEVQQAQPQSLNKSDIKQRIKSPGLDKDMAIQILAVDNPQLLKQFYEETVKAAKKETHVAYEQVKDNRIPNSLYTEISPQKFDPANYLKQDQNKPSKAKIYDRSQASNRQSSVRKPSNEQRITDQQAYAFPTIAKVLTYSNLKLGKQLEESELNQVHKTGPQNRISGVHFSGNQPKPRFSSISQHPKQSQKNSINNIDSSQPYQQNHYQKPILNNQKNNYFSDVRKSLPSEQNLLQQEKQILSRVVNLDQELQKSQINSPIKSKNKLDTPNSKNQHPNQIFKQNDICPVTQYNNNFPQFSQHQRHLTHQGKFINPPPQAIKKHKPSFLVLNLLVQIETKSIGFMNKKEKFHLIHRPYGCKQRIKLGPKFETNRITIICPVSEELVSKMDKVPFIIEFWGAVSNQFLGFFKINLSKIKKGFMLQGRLNEIAIKSSLLPIIIQRGEINIENVHGQKSGQCTIYAAIGTSAQMEMYLNTDRKFDKKQIEETENLMKKDEGSKKKKHEINTKFQETEQKLDLKNAHILLTNFLYYIDNNSNRNIQKLSELMKKKEVTQQEFQEFIVGMNPLQQRVKELVYIFRKMDPNVQQRDRKLIQTASLKHSFDQYKEMQESIIKDFNRVNKLIQKRMSAGLREQISKSASFNIIQKTKLNVIYEENMNNTSGQNPQYEKQIFSEYYLSFFDDYVNTKTIFSEEKLNSFYEPTQKLIINKVTEHFYEILFQHNVSVQYLQLYLQENINPKDQLTVKLFNFCSKQLQLPQKSFSLWYWLCLCQLNQSKYSQQNLLNDFILHIKQIQQRLQNQNIIKQKLATQQAQQNQKHSFQQTQRRKIQEPLPKKQQIEKNESASITYSNIHHILNQNQGQNLLNNVLNNISVNQSTENPIKYPDNILIQKQNIDDSNSQSHSQINDQKQAKCYEHVFSIKGLELFLEFPFDGECQVNYFFPFDDQPIGSKKIKVFKNKHRYAISLFSQHKITIENDIQTYMNEIPVKFQLINLSCHQDHHEILLEGNLHPDELLLQNNTIESKVVPLFGEDSQKIEGKVKIQVTYQFKETEKSSLGKETVYNLFLPKSGFVNFGFEVKLQEQKIKSQYRLQGDQFYVSMVIDFFHESKVLRPQYPPIISKLYSNLDEEIQFTNAIKTSLNPAILEYIKEKTCMISLMLTTYCKQKGNYEKKEITFATLKIPLFNLIKEQGIEGNYAFKNKYGMFIGLCKGKLKYERYEKKDSQINSQSNLGNTIMSNQNRLNNYWILIHFKELINFQPDVQTTFIKFETILNSTKFQTQKIHLSDDPLLIFNDLIAISLSQEQFMSTKIIPISIIMDQNKRFGMDISIRPITKKMNKQNYFVSGGYFLVVDENSDLTKMRIGARVVAFKGNSIIQPFVTSFCNNINVDVLSQIDLKRDLENYPKLLDIFKNELKLSKKTFEDSLKQILPHKNDKFPLQLLSSQLLQRLDLTPIVAENQNQVDSLARSLEGTASVKALSEFVEENEYKLTNFYSEILSQYTFESLWGQKIDKNVEYFNFGKEVDILTLARKIKVIDADQSQDEHTKHQRKYKQLKITIEQGVNFHYLYNGIKPNILLKLPQLSYESKIKPRSSQPVFNESLREIVEPQNQMMYKNLEFLVYHVSNGKKGQQEEILIGNGKLNVFSRINLSRPKQDVQQETAKVIISSTMSSKMKATLQLSLKLSYIGESELNKSRLMEDNNLEDASRIQEMIKDINKEMDDKKFMFEQSSDEDY